MMAWWEEGGLADPRHFWAEYSRRLYEVPRAWAHKGQNLVHAFEVLADQETSFHFDVRAQAMMMAGMACEVMLKAVLVNNPEVLHAVTASPKQLDDQGRKVRSTFFRHELLPLFELARVPLTEAEALVADCLSEYIIWRGRYVVPRESDVDDFIPIRHADGLIGGKDRSLDRATVRALLDKVIEVVKRELYQGQP